MEPHPHLLQDSEKLKETRCELERLRTQLLSLAKHESQQISHRGSNLQQHLVPSLTARVEGVLLYF